MVLTRAINEEILKIEPYGIILLNCESVEPCWYIKNPNYIQGLWNNSSLKLAADGASNFLSTVISKGFSVPDFIIGDLDSITGNTIKYFSSLNVPIKDLSHDQDSTDLQKCISTAKMYFHSLNRRNKIKRLFIITESSGRLDHLFNIFHSMALYCNDDIEFITVISCSSICILVPEGESVISVGSHLNNDIQIGNHVGLIPISTSRTIVTTEGLKWNLRT